jgi:thiol-disulfide isomerase/thioredoxin
VKSLLPIVIVLSIATAFGFWHNRSRGKVVVKSDKGLITAAMIGAELGSRATLLQFSSAFCGPCRATRLLIEDVTADMADVAHVEIDAEANLELVRKLDIRSQSLRLVNAN